MEMLGLADTLRELHASSRSSSSNTRLFPVEMSRARKSSETICPERFCGPPQHSEEPADKGAVGLGRVFREIQVQQDVKRKKRLPRGGVEETGGQDLGGGGGRRHRDRNEAHIVSNGAQKKKNIPADKRGAREVSGGGGCCSARETDPKRIKAARATETSGGQEETQHLSALHADGPEPGKYQQPLSRCTEDSLSRSRL